MIFLYLKKIKSGMQLVLIVFSALVLVSCMYTFITEPFAFFETPKGNNYANVETESGKPYVIALDAGHGGSDTGASGTVDEVVVCEKTTKALFALLEKDANFTPVRTRENGTDLSTTDRAKNADMQNAVLLLSIHANSDKSNSQSHGFECFPTPPGRTHHEEALRFAHCLVSAMEQAGNRIRGENGVRFLYYSNGGKTKKIVESEDTAVREMHSFGMVEKPNCPAVLAEQCFLTNDNDLENWASDQGCERTAKVYYTAICAYFNTEAYALQ